MQKLNKEILILQVHPIDQIGAPSWLVWKGKNYVIGYESQNIKELRALAPGQYVLEVSGEEFYQDGYMPNPMHPMPGITLSEWKIMEKR